MKTRAQTHRHFHVIFHPGSGLPPYQAEKTLVGGGEVNLSGPEFPLKALSHTNINQTVCVCVCVCVCVVKRCRQLEVFHGQQCVDQGGEGYSQVKPAAGQSTFSIKA